MLTAKEAVAAATIYMQDLFGELDDLHVEEIEMDGMQWLVTMGYWEYLPGPKHADGLATFLEPRKVRRAFKEFRINRDNGEVVSMKIRPAPLPEGR